MPVLAGDQHRGEAVDPRGRILVQQPIGMTADSQASAPARADPAAGQRGPWRFGLRPGSRGANQAGRLAGPDPQRTGDLLGGLPPLPQQTYRFETLIGLHGNRS